MQSVACRLKGPAKVLGECLRDSFAEEPEPFNKRRNLVGNVLLDGVPKGKELLLRGLDKLARALECLYDPIAEVVDLRGNLGERFLRV